jgi:hypothetical protein
LNYKAGKKYVKAVSRAVNRANTTPQSWAGSNTNPPSFYTAQTSRGATLTDDDGDSFLERTTSTGIRGGPQSASLQASIPVPKGREDAALTDEADELQYGSFVATPPGPGMKGGELDDGKTFELPGPALQAPTQSDAPTRPNATQQSINRRAMPRSASAGDTPTQTSLNSHHGLLSKTRNIGRITQSPSQLRRLFSHHGGLGTRMNLKSDIGLTGFDLVREREAEFYRFMDSELEKVESFYKLKEEQAGQRLSLLKEQLHEMRNRRIQELAEDSRHKDQDAERSRHGSDADRSNGWVRPIKAKIFPPGPNSRAMQFMPRTPKMDSSSAGDGGRDYIRRPVDHDVSYRTAKRKLKLALQEFYRGMELLKSYALLNRTAFRKLNKKYDKAVNAKPQYRYVNEKVNKAWFVESDVLEGHIKAVEDLYARYFERGNYKLAAGKLRSLTKKHSNQSGSSFQNGFLIGTGAVFSVQGVIYGAQLLFHHDQTVRQQTSYLMQVYGGYFLMLALFSLFCIDCMIWTNNKINYPFIFEFDLRHHLDWIQLAEFPSFFLFLFGLIIWINFSRYGPEDLYLYYPVILIGITAIVVLLPFPVLAHRSRKWFAYSHVSLTCPKAQARVACASETRLIFLQWRLLLSGLYPVEFRDFFLGDIYCSLTYATAVSTNLSRLCSTPWLRCSHINLRTPSFSSACMRIIGRIPFNATQITLA